MTNTQELSNRLLREAVARAAGAAAEGGRRRLLHERGPSTTVNRRGVWTPIGALTH